MTIVSHWSSDVVVFSITSYPLVSTTAMTNMSGTYLYPTVHVCTWPNEVRLATPCPPHHTAHHPTTSGCRPTGCGARITVLGVSRVDGDNGMPISLRGIYATLRNHSARLVVTEKGRSHGWVGTKRTRPSIKVVRPMSKVISHQQLVQVSDKRQPHYKQFIYLL